jgi:hypothetical protein
MAGGQQERRAGPCRRRTASGLENWTFTFSTSSFGKGNRTILVRLVSGGAELARSTVRSKFD